MKLSNINIGSDREISRVSGLRLLIAIALLSLTTSACGDASDDDEIITPDGDVDIEDTDTGQSIPDDYYGAAGVNWGGDSPSNCQKECNLIDPEWYCAAAQKIDPETRVGISIALNEDSEEGNGTCYRPSPVEWDNPNNPKTCEQICDITYNQRTYCTSAYDKDGNPAYIDEKMERGSGICHRLASINWTEEGNGQEECQNQSGENWHCVRATTMLGEGDSMDYYLIGPKDEVENGQATCMFVDPDGKGLMPNQ